MEEDHTYKVLVPAHLASERLAEKVLIELKGKAMLLRVLEQCKEAVGRENVGVVTPDPKIHEAVHQWGYTVYRSDPGLPDGSSAIAAAVTQIEADFILNVQGDQPLVPPDLIRSLLEHLIRSKADMVTPVFRITEPDDLAADGVAKVVRDLAGWALYFSRSPIPYLRDIPYSSWLNTVPFWGHYGIYGYPRAVLLNLGKLKESYLESGEKLEQLRLLQNGLRIFTFETDHRQLAVDTREDLEKILGYI